ncbi:MAG: hypothetical protein L3J96_06545, partial [Thermoplasmata archaeon]|nr:hypothetical protein [Thermoplasmata archaeon]
MGQTAIVLGPPMHDVVDVQEVGVSNPQDLTLPSFPISNVLTQNSPATWPESYANMTWVNATPDRVVDLGSVDVTPGTYLEGNVSLPGTAGSPDGQFEVQVCSTDVPSECGSRVQSSDLEPSVSGCAIGPASFCAPAPPGPDEITVTGLGPGDSNRTWVEVPSGCCGQDGHPTEVGWINLTLPPQEGTVSGSVVAETGGPGSATVPIAGVLLSVQACPVGPPPPGLPSVACTAGVLDATGNFSFNASLGWDIVSVVSNYYQGNWTWVDLTGNNSTGVIELAPKAAFVGQVVTPTGAGVYAAVVDACPIGQVLLCYIIGDTSSDGVYNGTVPGGPLPWGTYEVTASSSGYASDITWVNSTPGAVIRVPTITLYPVGSSPSAPRAGSASSASVGAWVDGRLIDSLTGLGVPDASVNECSVVTGGCTGSNAMSTDGGTFNLSLLLGQYYFEVNASGYPVKSIYVNATSTNVVHLGAIALTHDPWVFGRVVIDPWQSLAVTDGLGAPVSVIGCPPVTVSAYCGPIGSTNPAGFFNVSVPASGSAYLEFLGDGIQGFGSDLGGVGYTTMTVSALGTYVYLTTSGPNVPSVPIFGTISGRLTDGSTWNATDHAARRPCAFCSLTTVQTGGYQSVYFASQVGGGGN